MRKLLITLFVTIVSCLSVKAEFVPEGEYYIWLNIYEKLLGSDTTNTVPVLSAYDVNEDKDGYVFVAEDSGKSGYVLLRQKGSNRYLAASGSDTWSIVFEGTKSTADRFCWKMEGQDCYAYLINKKNESKENRYVGIDGAKKGNKNVSIYYDKRKSSHGQFSVIPAPANGTWDEARWDYESAVYTNAQGVQEIDYCQLNNKTIDRSDAVDIHITSNDNPMLGSSSVNLGSDRTWLIFDNIIPSQVISTYLNYVTINGVAAQKDVNCRVAIYLNGAAVIPIPSVVMTCDGTEGEFTLAVGNHKDLSEVGQSNTMTSFTLRRGYMATLACGTNGSWYSRVFVADHADQVITLPNALTKRVSSVNIKPWQYLSKKGWGYVNEKDGNGYSHGRQLRASWFWTWSADQSSTNDWEYVPCHQHMYWPSASDVNNKTATAAISINEPDHPEQHRQQSKPCTCDVNSEGKVTAKSAYGLNDDFQASGGRIGSPQPTDFSYLNTYFGYVDDNSYSRCDFAVTHAYWDVGSRDADTYAKYVTDRCWNIWHDTNRPVWLTEMEVGASWSNYAAAITSYDKAREYLQALLTRLEESDYIERYAIYGFDYWLNKMFYDEGGITPAGQVYRDHRSTFAYNASRIKVPNWSAPDTKKPSITYSVNLEDRTIVFSINNPNGDSTGELVIEHKPNGGSWTTLKSFDGNRSLLESNTVTMTVSFNDVESQGDTFRVTSTTLYDKSSTSEEVAGPAIADLESVPALIAEAETHQLGFESGEYAPYNNVEVVKALAVVKAMNPNAANFSEACQTLAEAKWVVNEEEVNAVYDGTFAHAENNGAPAGWTMSNSTLGGNLHSRAFVGDNRLSEFNETCSGFFIRFDGTYSNRGSLYYYGRTEGYTMPLKAGANYRLTVDATGWNSTGKPLVLRVTGPSGFTAVDQQIKTESKAETEDKKPQQFVIDFTATVAGNYEFYFQCPGSDDNKHIAIVSNISLTRVVEKGDVDGSNVIDINDVKALVNSILGNKPVGFFDKAADLNGDGSVNISDVTKLIEKVLSSQ